MPDELEGTPDQQKIEGALRIAYMYGGCDGAHHKQWVIDQMVQALAGDGYDEWVRRFNLGEEGPDTYIWEGGYAP